MQPTADSLTDLLPAGTGTATTERLEPDPEKVAVAEDDVANPPPAPVENPH